MNNRTFSFACLLALLLPLSACHSSKIKSGSATGLKEDTPEAMMDQLIRNQLYAEWLDAKAKISYNDGYTSVSASASIKMRKDSVLWISVKKLGFEVARMQVTRDSVYILDRLNNQYAVKDLHYIETTLNMPANLQMLQAFVLGNPVFFTRKNLQMETGEKSYHLWGKDEQRENHFWMNRQKLVLEKTSLADERAGRNLALELKENADLSGNQNFSYLRQLELNSRESGKINAEISFSSVEINNPIEIRFEIPERYTRMD